MMLILDCFREGVDADEFPMTVRRVNSRRNDLVSMALTYRAWCDPALDILWRTQVSLRPLLRTFPEDLWKEITNVAVIQRRTDPSTVCHNYMELARDVVPADWSRPLLYARRINTFVFTGEGLPPSVCNAGAVHHTALSTILRTAPAEGLLPNLLELIADKIPLSLFGSRIDSYGPWILSMSNPNLRLLSLSHHVVPEAEFSSLVDAIFSKCCDLETFRIRYHYRLGPTVMLSSSQVSQLRRLRSLQLSSLEYVKPSPLSPDTTISFGLLETLREAEFNHVDAITHACNTYHGDLFIGLQKLRLQAITLMQCTSLISVLSTTQLEEITLSAIAPRSRSFHDVFECLAKQPSRIHKLRSLIFILRGLQPEENASDSPSIFQPLLSGSFCTLRRLEVKIKNDKFPENITLALDAIPDALPLIEILNFPYFNVPGVTFETILHLANRCVYLKVLGIGLGDSNIPVISSEETPALSLELLKVGHSAIPSGHPGEIALFFQKWFPNLRKLKASNASMVVDEWEEISRLLEVKM
ncbi:hypothetical protein BJ138DRAFT_1119210 [Hygrophoropsis aurantiaca]|uniref:Uncharacterized protein n=1 Tax=Hygrophoropsis aurantiaca TaxID=72124 RepID=A0ACB7ZUA1_9AGAM|nr:hypothetical protein BJ138DRAFT_1119210 [Hygrophoropsis aurantiaca]